ncbi:hypothetical protein WA1_06760 [Scytonema hofmannii PCC 7110]|uniref:Uncharacterized protein n=1 Tax=Scytonema hofmannii PCC 7110 TaxID=128403 RepID=A0A139WSW5_9CYAN|nr:hypothetical protein [Scytonema hofmannii]KYC35521.1 hypothetical protein WA1_06760 [Scytonema hofmannii PCC 7110]
MTNAGQPPQPQSIEERLTRLETLFANVGETVVGHDATIDVLVANIQQLTENLNNLGEQTNRNINNLAEQAAQDRQQAAIDRQNFRNEIRQIWEYLRDRFGWQQPTLTSQHQEN